MGSLRYVLLAPDDTPPYHSGHYAPVTPAPVPDPPTPDEQSAYAERLHHLLNLPDLPTRPVDLTRVGLCPHRRTSLPWTNDQRRVALVWRGMEGCPDAGAAGWYAEHPGPGQKQKPYPYKSIEERREVRQARIDREDAQEGTQWLREYAADTDAALETAFTRAGLTLDEVRPAFALKGGRLGKGLKAIRTDALRVLAILCPDVVPVASAAEVLGVSRVKLSSALGKAREDIRGDAAACI